MKTIDGTARIDGDREALLAWASLPRNQESYPDFGCLLYALPYSVVRRSEDSVHPEAVFIHLNVARGDTKSLYIRINDSKAKRLGSQMQFLHEIEIDGNRASNCLGWEEARDMIVSYMALGPFIDPSTLS